MSGLQLIGLGLTPDDGRGDTARVAGAKINAMFAELYDLIHAQQLRIEALEAGVPVTPAYRITPGDVAALLL